jgi:hypothetical protein
MADADPFLADLRGVVAEVQRVTDRAASADRWRDAAGRDLSGEARGHLDVLQGDLGRLGVELRRLSLTRETRSLLRTWERRLRSEDAS